MKCSYEMQIWYSSIDSGPSVLEGMATPSDASDY